MIRIFKIEAGEIVLNDICTTSKTLKRVQDVFAENENFKKVYLLIYYLLCPDRDTNPYCDLPEDEKKEVIVAELGIDFSLDEPAYNEAFLFCEKLYTTPTRRFFTDCKIGMERQGEYLRTTKITYGRDGNDTTYLATLKSVGAIAKQFMEVQKLYEQEVGAALRGGAKLAYDES